MVNVRDALCGNAISECEASKSTPVAETRNACLQSSPMTTSTRSSGSTVSSDKWPRWPITIHLHLLYICLVKHFNLDHRWWSWLQSAHILKQLLQIGNHSSVDVRRDSHQRASMASTPPINPSKPLMMNTIRGGQLVHWLIIVLLLTLSTHLNVCDAKVKIHQIKVPKFVENGTEQSVVLDCIYTLVPGNDSHLVVKWFLNDDPEPIYQWIEQFDSRRVPQRFNGRINLNYSIPTTDRYQKYRALNLIRPTVDLTGRYSCHILTISSQDSADANMVVFAKTKAINLVSRRVMREQSTALQQTVQQNGDGHMFTGWSSQSSPSSSVSSAGLSSSSSSWLFGQLGAQLSSTATAEIQCSVNNVFPLPELTIYQVLNDGLRPRSLTNARYSQNITQLPNGAYYASVTAVIEDTELLLEQTHHPRSLHHAPGSYGPTMFECLVSQDEIRHELRKRTIYSPSSEDAEYDASSSVGSSSAHQPLFYCLLLLLLATVW